MQQIQCSPVPTLFPILGTLERDIKNESVIPVCEMGLQKSTCWHTRTGSYGVFIKCLNQSEANASIRNIYLESNHIHTFIKPFHWCLSLYKKWACVESEWTSKDSSKKHFEIQHCSHCVIWTTATSTWTWLILTALCWWLSDYIVLREDWKR